MEDEAVGIRSPVIDQITGNTGAGNRLITQRQGIGRCGRIADFREFPVVKDLAIGSRK